MKSQILKNSIISVLFLVLVFLGFMILQPIYNKTIEKLNWYKDSLLATVEEQLGVEISYESLSPAILSTFSISSIEVKNVDNGNTVAQIGKAKLHYDLIALIKKQGNIFDTLYLENVDLNWNQQQNESLVNKIKAFVLSIKKNKDDSDVSLKLPFDINIKNVNCELLFDEISVNGTVKTLVVKQDKKASLNIEIEGNTTVLFSEDSSYATYFTSVAGVFNGKVVINPQLDNSSLRFHVTSLETPVLNISSFDLVGQVTDDNVEFSFLQNMLPFHATASYGLTTKTLSFSLEADDFDPFDMISISSESKLYQKYTKIIDTILKAKGMKLSGSYSFILPENMSFTYSGSGSLSIPSSLIKNGLSASYSVFGSKTNLAVSNLNISQKFVNASFSGDIDLRTFMPQGLLKVNSVNLPNGNTIGTEVFLDRQMNNLICFIPQLDLGGQLYTAVQLMIQSSTSSYDFQFEAYDYSHQDFGEPGVIAIDGSFLTDNGFFLQSGVSFTNFFADSLVGTIKFFTNKNTTKTLTNMQSKLSPYIITNEAYVSTDLKSISFNAPYTLIANIQKDGQVLLFSADGNDNSIQFSQFNLVFGGQSVMATIQADISEDFSDVIFSSSMTVNSIPYNLSGAFIPGTYANLVGDYGLDAFIDLSNKNALAGQLSLSSFPVSVKDWLLSFSLDSTFTFPSDGNWNVSFSKFECEELSGKLKNEPFIASSGSIDKYGMMVEEVIWKDSISMVEGNAAFSWDIVDSTISSISTDVSLASSDTSEAYSAIINITNPFKFPISMQHVLQDFYLSAQVTVNDSPSSRIRVKQENNDVVNMSFSVLGTLENPSLSLELFDSSLRFANVPIKAELSVRLEDKVIDIYDTNFVWGGLSLTDVEANYSLANLDGFFNGNASFDTSIMQIAVPLNITVETSSSTNKKLLDYTIPDTIIAKINLPEIKSSFFDTVKDVSLTFTRQPGYMELYGGPDESIQGYYSELDQNIILSLGGTLPIRLDAAGLLSTKAIDLNVSNLYGDVRLFMPIINRDVFSIYTGIVTGDVRINGMLRDPDFTGDLVLNNVEIAIPNFVESHLYTETVNVKAIQKQLIAEDAVFQVKTIDSSESSESDNSQVSNKSSTKNKENDENKNVEADIVFTFDKWGIGNLQLDVKTQPGLLVGAKVNIKYLDITADASCELSINVTLTGVVVTGNLSAQDAVVNFYPGGKEVTSLVATPSTHGTTVTAKKIAKPFDVNLKLDVNIGQRVQMYMYWPTMTNLLMRAVVAPQTKLSLNMDSTIGSVIVNSDINLRGGEIMYFQRNFYIREGRVVFDGTSSEIDPKLTLRAEIRERDDSGEQVKITMSAENQRLSEFNPSFSSSPPKSEQEMMLLLGQAALADLSKSVTAGQAVLRGVTTFADYGLEVTMFRQIENALRDLLKTDIFSIKLSFLQNAAVLAYEVNTTGKQVKASNFLDNSTVYIGKYFGNAIYFDTLFHVSFDDSLVQSDDTVGGLVFQPEIGLEMASPFATIRWSLAPEIGPDLETFTKDLLVPAVSISLSWKIVF